MELFGLKWFNTKTAMKNKTQNFQKEENHASICFNWFFTRIMVLTLCDCSIQQSPRLINGIMKKEGCRWLVVKLADRFDGGVDTSWKWVSENIFRGRVFGCFYIQNEIFRQTVWWNDGRRFLQEDFFGEIIFCMMQHTTPSVSFVNIER